MATYHEVLETRRLLAVDAVVDGATFGIRGTADADILALVITDNSATLSEAGEVDRVFDLTGVRRYRFFLGDGDDQFDLQFELTTLKLGERLTLYGGAGNDNVSIANTGGALGGYRLYGEAGDDNFGVASTFPSFNVGATIYGGDGDDFIVGGSGRDLLSGDDGNDELYGFSARDVLLGGAGEDELYGGSFDSDVLDGGPGADKLRGGKGPLNVFSPIDLQDAIDSDFDPQFDRLFADPDADDVNSDEPRESVMLIRDGIVTVVGSDGSRLNPASASDQLTILASGNTLKISTANRVLGEPLLGDLTGLRVFLNEGDDVLGLRNLPPGLPTTVYGGGGNDAISSFNDASTPGGIIGGPVVRFYGESGDDTFTSSDRSGRKYLYGGSGDDTLSGGSDDDYISGGNGKDDLAGRDGADVLLGGNDLDRIDGGKGAEFSPSTGRPDTLRGGGGADVLNGWGGVDVIFGDSGPDLFAGYEVNGNIGAPSEVPQVDPTGEVPGQVQDYDPREDLLS
ncbi:MAG: calcium-binding protein [Planctomycetota bacterium]